MNKQANKTGILRTEKKNNTIKKQHNDKPSNNNKNRSE